MSRILAQLASRFDADPTIGQPRAGSAGDVAGERIVQAGFPTESCGLHRRASLVKAAAHRVQPFRLGLPSVQFRPLPPRTASRRSASSAEGSLIVLALAYPE